MKDISLLERIEERVSRIASLPDSFIEKIEKNMTDEQKKEMAELRVRMLVGLTKLAVKILEKNI